MISCKKDSSSSTDSIIAQSIHGQVYNFCTDSGLANVTVFLNINNSANGGTTIQTKTVSGTNGNFTFNVPVHSSNDYTYELKIPSVSGIGGGTQPAIDGCDGDIIKSNINNIQKLCVVPHSGDITLFFPGNVNYTPNDTFLLTIQQNILHKNVPSAVYSLTISIGPYPAPAPPINALCNIGSYWMGLWHTTLNRTTNGVHIIKTDSFYVCWWKTVTDTIPW